MYKTTQEWGFQSIFEHILLISVYCRV